jgi:hypothetical protein
MKATLFRHVPGREQNSLEKLIPQAALRPEIMNANSRISFSSGAEERREVLILPI